MCVFGVCFGVVVFGGVVMFVLFLLCCCGWCLLCGGACVACVFVWFVYSFVYECGVV